jgi:hypothetical protein
MSRQLFSSVAALAIGWSICADAVAQTPGVIASYSLASPSITVGEPVFLNVELRNESDSQITIDLGLNRKQNFSFHVVFPDGTTSDLSLPQKEEFAEAGRMSMQPWRQYTDTLVLNEWISIARTGIYRVTVTLSEDEAHTRSTVPPYQFVFEVLARDETKLRAVCERLSEQVRNSRSVREAQYAALALSFVNDSVAVPFLANALASGRSVEIQAIAGLERIGDIGAVQALAAAIPRTAAPPDPNTVSGTRTLLIRSALQNIRDRTTDSRVRKAIQEALRMFSP